MQLSRSYQLIRKLGAGGMAEVWLARADGPRGFSKTLVLKRILPHLAGDEQFVEMFLREAQLVAQINHPHVVQIFDFGEFDGAYFIAMEYIDGPNLRGLMRKAHSVGLHLPPALCAKIVSSACEGLAHAHELVDPVTQKPLGLVHRDVSPDNILISRNGTVKVVDFGIAKVVGQKHRTQTGLIKGKLPYMPPEQMRSRPLDRRVDVFALGIVLYELLTFKRPFDARSETEIMEAILHKPMKRLAERLPEAPEALERIIQRCLAKDREERYPGCRPLRTDLERFILSTGEPVGAEELAALVARLMPEGLPSSPADSPAPMNKSPAPRALVGATPPPVSKPREAKVRSSPESLVVEAAPREKLSAGALERAVTGTDPSVILLVNPKEEASSAAFAVTAASGKRPMPPRLPEHSLEVGEMSTARLPGRGRVKDRTILVAALIGGMVAAVSAAIVLRRASLSSEEGGQLAVAPAPPVIAPAPPPPEAPEKAAPNEGDGARPPEAPADPASPRSLADALKEAGRAPGPEHLVETHKPVVPARRARALASGGDSGQKKREADVEPAPPPTSMTVGSDPASPQPLPPVPSASPVPSAAPEPAASQPELATAVISSSPPAQVRVNGQFVGLAPVTLRRRTPGRLQVEVYDSVKGFAKVQTFILDPGDNGVLHVPVEQGNLELQIHPHAVVFVDGKRVGETPLGPITLYEGQHELRLESQALGKQLITTLTIEPRQTSVFKFNLDEEK